MQWMGWDGMLCKSRFTIIAYSDSVHLPPAYFYETAHMLIENHHIITSKRHKPVIPTGYAFLTLTHSYDITLPLISHAQQSTFASYSMRPG